MTKPSLRDYLHLHFLVLIWGFTAILGLLIDVPPLALTFYRTLLAAIGLLVLLYLRGQLRPVEGKTRWQLLGVGLLMGVHWFTFFASARASNASVCLAGMATTSLWTALLQPLLTRQRVRPLEVALGLVVIAGLYVIFRFEFNHALGLSLALVSAFLAAIFTISNGALTRHYPAALITFYEMLGACLSTGVFWLIYLYVEPTSSGSLLPDLSDWLWIAILAWVCTVYAYSAGVHLLRVISPFTFNLTVNMEPVYGILLAYLIFGKREQMTPGFYVGTFIILLAVILYPLLSRRPANRRPTTSSPPSPS